jgi:hypothetical protein
VVAAQGIVEYRDGLYSRVARARTSIVLGLVGLVGLVGRDPERVYLDDREQI